jgi:hypothetical protein
MRWQGPRRDREVDPFEHPVRVATAAPADVVLRLQRRAGNRAVARLLAPVGPALARFAVQVRTDATMDERWVSDIRVAGRPKRRLISKAEGSHVTAWAVFADVVRRQLVGRDPDDALTEAKTMLNAQSVSLRADWKKGQPEAVQKALEDADTALADLPDDADDARTQSQLQEVIAAYLTLHNLRPGTAVLIGAGKAKGAGEAGRLSTLRKHEVDGNQPVLVLSDAFFGMLDALALDYIRQLTVTSPTAPGVDPGDSERVGRAVLNGLADLAAAYPRTYATVVTKQDVTDWLASKSLPTLLPGPLPVPADVEPAPAGWSRTDEDAAQESNERSAVCQIVLGTPAPRADGKPARPRVEDVRIAGRPPTLTKGEQGHHTVAWSLEAARLVSLLKHKPLEGAAATLRTTGGETVGELEAGLEWLTEEETADGASEDSKYTRSLLQYARDDLQQQIDALDPNESDALAVMEAMQRLAEAWMRAMNVMPLASADIGANPDSHGESTAIPALKANEKPADGKRKQKLSAKQLWVQLQRLFDNVAVGYLHGDANVGRAYPADKDTRVAVIVGRYLRACKAAFPLAYGTTQMGSERGVMTILGWLDVKLDDQAKVIAQAQRMVDGGEVRRSERRRRVVVKGR